MQLHQKKTRSCVGGLNSMIAFGFADHSKHIEGMGEQSKRKNQWDRKRKKRDWGIRRKTEGKHKVDFNSVSSR